ncbi:MAG: DUF1971 domain-containing protein [Sandaracinaceae bacterium]
MPNAPDAPYKQLSFGPGELPAAFLREHRLAAGVRGELDVLAGSVTFVDAAGTPRVVRQGERVEIPPATPHHLEDAEDATLRLSFFRV